MEDCIKEGSLVFHQVDGVPRILRDINTLVTYTEEKSADFAANQTIRVLDQVANDIAMLFAEKYIGKIANDGAGRISLWNDIVKHHQELERIRAIEGFDPEVVKVEQGDNKQAVVVTDCITPVNAMLWEMKTITSTEDETLRKSCAKQVAVPGRKNQYQRETDYDMYLGKLAVTCTVYPNLNDKGLQDSYGVMGAEALLKTMLTPGEYANYIGKVQEVCGFDVTFQDEVEEAKN